MLIDKDTLNALTVVPKENNNKLKANIILTESMVFATNEVSLYYQRYCSQSIEGYPYSGATEIPQEAYPLHVPVKAVIKAVKNAPKKTSVPILDNVLFQSQSPDNSRVDMITTDNEFVDTVSVNVDEYSWTPNVSDILETISNREKETVFTLSLKELERLVTVAKRTKNCEYIKFSVSDTKSSDAIAVTIGESGMRGVIMPYRTED